MNARVAVMFGQYGGAADPINLPNFRNRLSQRGVETILVQHFDSKPVYDFLKGFDGFRGIVGASLGAMSSVVCAGYLSPTPIDFVGGFQPSDWDPSGHAVNLMVHTEFGDDLITRAVTVPANVRAAVCFRNPQPALTGGLGHAAYIVADPQKTNLTTINRLDVHPGDFGVAQDTMVETIMERIG